MLRATGPGARLGWGSGRTRKKGMVMVNVDGRLRRTWWVGNESRQSGWSPRRALCYRMRSNLSGPVSCDVARLRDAGSELHQKYGRPWKKDRKEDERYAEGLASKRECRIPIPNMLREGRGREAKGAIWGPYHIYIPARKLTLMRCASRRSCVSVFCSATSTTSGLCGVRHLTDIRDVRLVRLS